MGVKVKNLDSFDLAVQKWFSNVEKAAAQAAVGLAKVAFNHILENSPQYSGDFVANWNVGLKPSSRFVTFGGSGTRLNAYGHYVPLKPFQRGDSPAIDHAKSRAQWPTLTLGQSIFLSNSAAHDEPYALKIEDGTIKFRPVNGDAGHVVARAKQHVGLHYKHISKAALAALQKV